MYQLAGTECCERLAYFGIATNLVTYLTTELHQGNAEAARNVTTWSGTCYLTTLIGAVIADAYWGKYWAIAVFSTIYLIVSSNDLFLSYPFIMGNFLFWPDFLRKHLMDMYCWYRCFAVSTGSREGPDLIRDNLLPY